MSDLPLIRCAYVSQKTRPLSPPEMATMLANARANNDRLGLTGILLDSDRFYFQILEGESSTVRAMIQRIGADPRHSDILILVVAEPAPGRLFADWTMAHYSLEPAAAPLPGAADSSLPDFLSEMRALPSCPSVRLLQEFVESHWTGLPSDDPSHPELRDYLVQRA